MLMELLSLNLKLIIPPIRSGAKFGIQSACYAEALVQRYGVQESGILTETHSGRSVFARTERDIHADGGIESFMQLPGGIAVIEWGNAIHIEGRV